MSDRAHYAAAHQPAPPPRMENDDDEFSDDEDHAARKQMTYGELVRKFSMHSEKIQRAYFEAKQKLEEDFDYNQFVKCRK
jgi:hypothetical protein